MIVLTVILNNIMYCKRKKLNDEKMRSLSFVSARSEH